MPSKKNPSGIKAPLTVTTTTQTDSEILLPDDLLISDYIFSKLVERITDYVESGQVHGPLNNSWRFDYISILKDFGKKDSGGYREWLDSIFERIFSTSFEITTEGVGLEFMELMGFVDDNGEPYDKVKINLLRPIGIKLEDQKSDDLPSRKTGRYIDVALPDNIMKSINDAIMSGQDKLLQMYNRDLRLIRHQDAGLAWAIINYLETKLPKPGFKIGPVDLKKFAGNVMAAWSTDEIGNKGVMTLNKLLIQKDRLLYIENHTVDSRKNSKYDLLYARFGNHFLAEIKSLNPEVSKTSFRKYEIKIVRMTKDEILVADERAELIQSNINYAEDESYRKFASAIIAKADIEAQKYKYS